GLDLCSLHAGRDDPPGLRIAMRPLSIRREDTGNSGVLETGWRLQTRLGVRDVLRQRVSTAEQVDAVREVIELDRIQDGGQILRTQFRRVLIAQPAAGLNGAANELHWG